MIKAIKEMLPWGILGALMPILFLGTFFGILFLLNSVQ